MMLAVPHAAKPSPHNPPKTAWIVASIVAVWLAVIVVLGRAEVFVSGPASPPLPLFAAIAVPPALFALAYRAFPAVRAWALDIDPRIITAMQGWRVIGLVFLAFYAFDLLPGTFAWPAGLGDAAVGAGAVVALGAILRQAPTWRRQVFWLNIAGLADFAVAIATGVLTSNTAIGILNDGSPRIELGALPMSLIPTFAVPFWIVLHAISLIQVRKR